MRRKFLSIIIAGTTVLFPLMTEIGYAETLEGIQEKKAKVEKEKEEAKQEIEEIEEKLSELKDEIEELDKSIMETQEEIRQKEAEIEQQKEEIDKLNGEIQKLNEQIEQRIEILRNRAVAHQKSDVSDPYLQVLLGAQNFADFFSRLRAIGEIMDADKEIVEQLEIDVRLVEEKEQEEYELQLVYEQQLEELEELEGSLNEQSAEKEEALKEFESKAEVVLEELLMLEEEEEFLEAQEAAIIKAAEEAARRAKEEAERQAAQLAKEEAEKQAAQLAKEEMERQASQRVKEDTERQAAQNSRSNSSNLVNSIIENMPAFTEDIFMRPAKGPVTSEFGMRTLNGVAGFHHGIDIGKRGDHVPIVAAADGVVIRADYSTSYGNVVFITHNIDDEIYTTVYSHLENLFVESGEVVTQGQILGLMGNTGFSFGAHLHFEIHEGEWNVQKSNAVDPRKYIDFDAESMGE